MTFRAAAKRRKLLFLAAVCLASALLLSPTAEASRGLSARALNLEPPVPSWDAEAPPAPQLDLFHLEDEVLFEILVGVEPEDHVELLEHRRLELLPSSPADAAIQKTASGVSTSDLELNVEKGKPLKPDLRWTVPFYAKARFYDPEVGRFLTEDPAEPDLTTPPSLHKYLYAYGNPTYYVDPDGREVTITPKGNFVVSYPDGTVRTFTEERYSQNPAAVEAAVLESVAGDEAAARHDFQVGVLKWEYQQEHGTAPGDDEYIHQHSDETGPVYAITGSGEIHSASGDIEPDYTVETLVVSIVVPAALEARAVLAAGGTTAQAAGRAGLTVLDEGFSEATGLPVSPGSMIPNTPNLRTGRGLDAGDPPVRIEAEWSLNDMKQGLLGKTPRGLGKPDLHHGGQMPGAAKHEILPEQHRNNPALHPNRRNQGVTPEMRQADRQLHWWYRAREQGADEVLPGWIYDD